MRSVGTRAHDERGLVGKLLVLWLLLFAVLVVAAIDAGSIMLMKIKVSNAADAAAVAGAATFHTVDTRADAYTDTLRQLRQDLPEAKLRPEDFVINPSTGEVTVTITMRASTLVAGRLSFTKRFTKVTATSTAQPPGL